MAGSIGGIVTKTLRMFCEGFKVAVEIAAMAADAGLVRIDEDIVSIAGTGKGADTALVMSPAISRRLFDMKVKKILAKSKRVILFTDNCGEIVFDKILCKEIKKLNPDVFLTVVVKGEPIISDATIKDVEELKFEEVSDEILSTGCFAIGLDFDKIPPMLKKALESADLIICKGMANYEAFSETDYHPIAYLLRTKCTAIANSMNLPLNVSAVKLYQ